MRQRLSSTACLIKYGDEIEIHAISPAKMHEKAI